MGCGSYSISDTCGERLYATCVFYQTDLPEWSELLNQNCVTIEETTEELYNQLTDIRDSLDTSNLGENCLTYPTNEIDNIRQQDVNITFEQEICNLKGLLESTANPDGHFCSNLDYGDLVNPDNCEGIPTTWCEFAQFVLNILNDLNQPSLEG